MILSDVDLKNALEAGQLKIEPAPQPDSFSTMSIDLHLGDEFLTWDVEGAREVLESQGSADLTIDVADYDFKGLSTRFTKPLPPLADGSVVLEPRQFILAKTEEKVGNDDHGCCLTARVEGRSSLARLGLQIHMTAPTIQAGFFGKIALEMFNAGPFRLRLRPGLLICQLIVEQLSSPPDGTLARSQFQGQDSARGN